MKSTTAQAEARRRLEADGFVVFASDAKVVRMARGADHRRILQNGTVMRGVGEGLFAQSSKRG